MGWLATLAGLIRMFLPVVAQREVQNPTPVYAFLVVLLAIGILLTFKAYSRAEPLAAGSAVLDPHK